MRMHKPLIDRHREVAPRQRRAVEEPILPREHPLIELQRTIGNQAVLRMLGRGQTVQRESDGEKPSLKEQAEQYIWKQIEYRDKLITRALETIENNLMPEERQRKLPAVQNVKNIHLHTGILTLSMIETLQNAIKPVKVADYINRQFEFLWQDVKLKNEMLEALDDDPVHWQIDYMKRLSGH